MDNEDSLEDNQQFQREEVRQEIQGWFPGKGQREFRAPCESIASLKQEEVNLEKEQRTEALEDQ